MPDQAPLLVYTRVEQNRRNTAILLSLVPAILLPFVFGISGYVTPFIVVFGFLFAIASGWLTQETVMQHPMRLELIAMAIATAIVLAITTAATLLRAFTYRLSMMRRSGATPIAPEAEPELRRIVENLCIGSGLPMPQLYLVDSPVPNAFATGRDPEHASLAVTKGLLALLDRRELEGVVAHELAHIGNQDTRLSTAVASVVGTLRLPLAIVTGIYRVLAKVHVALAILFVVTFAFLMALLIASGVESIPFFEEADLPRWVLWRHYVTLAGPLFVLIGAPLTGLFIRQAISRQREFLADADAVVLTRDPEGLARALARIGAWAGPRTFNIGPAAAHLCIADPLRQNAVFWDRLFPCHPPMADRIAVLARMGAGVAESAAEAAAETKADAARAQIAAPPVLAAAPTSQALPTAATVEETIRPVGTAMYEQPDGWSKIVSHLAAGTFVTITGTTGNFLRVQTADGRAGYISQNARANLVTDAHHA